MNPESDPIRDVLLSALHRVAPEIDTSQIEGGVPLQEALDLDSMDFLSFMTALHEATGVDVPERDYPQVQTIDQCVAYVGAHQPAT